MKKQANDNITQTIAAVATPAGEGGIAVIRLSGPSALKIALKILKRDTLKDRVAAVCALDTGKVKDEVLALYFKGPRSFTGEDVVEIHCHGSYFLAGKIVDALIERGCRAAEPGEFTRRAFLNGRIDLTKAEGILDLIQSQSEAGIIAAYTQAMGGVQDGIGALQQDLTRLIASASAAVDYPEEDLEEPVKGEILKSADSVLKKLKNLKNSFAGGALIREGVRVAITGLPNVGKSLLLNRLLGFERAIVTSEAGTTRDTLEESFLFKGVRFILTDTAGIRKAQSEAEKLGVARSAGAVSEANLILAVSEADKEFTLELPKNKPVIFVKNKTDLFQNISLQEKGRQTKHGGASAARNTSDSDMVFGGVFNELQTDKVVYLSALKNENIEELKEKMYAATVGKISAKGVSINNRRHLTAVVKAEEALLRAKAAKDKSLDCVLSDLNEAYRALGSVTGVTATDEIINEIFAKFCVGK